jgi:basic membrane protein A and related proteins
MSVPRPPRRRPAALAAGSLLGISALLLSACGPAPEEGSDASGENEDYYGCIVSDSGGFDDRSFNQNSYEGLRKAQTDYEISVRQAESQAVTDYGPNITQMVQSGCNMVVTVGFNISDQTAEAAEANPDTHFAIVDDNQIDLPNVRPIIYDTSQAAFLAGYLAAGSSETGKVATFGGMEIPTVTIFMDGFAEGVQHYNEEKGEDVEVLGWNADAQTGTFTGDFEDTGKGKTTAQNFINEGADVVMPVAGPVGNGAVDAITAANADSPDDPTRIIWVDSDGYETLDNGQEYVLTSVIKKMGDAVESTIKDDLDGNFTNEPYVGTLENDGVGISEFHDQDEGVSDELKGELDDIRSQISSGELTVESPASPLNAR